MTSPPRVLLASASPARRTLLARAGIDPIVEVSGIDEDALVTELGPAADAATVVLTLAQAKAQAVAARHPGESLLVVGCDSMLMYHDQLLGKPRTAERAAAQWRQMAGGSGHLLTGHAVIELKTGRCAKATSVTTIKFSSPTDAQIEAYVATGEPLQVAGAFTLDGLGGWFIERIDGDPSAVIGLGLPTMTKLLDELGIDVTTLWQKE